jgi:hypothetical protein
LITELLNISVTANVIRKKAIQPKPFFLKFINIKTRVNRYRGDQKNWFLNKGKSQSKKELCHCLFILKNNSISYRIRLFMPKEF